MWHMYKMTSVRLSRSFRLLVALAVNSKSSSGSNPNITSIYIPSANQFGLLGEHYITQVIFISQADKSNDYQKSTDDHHKLLL